MKRAGHLFDLIWTRENLLSAFSRAAKGKWASDAVRRFAADLDDNLRGIAQALRAGEPRFGDYRRFMIRDPKEREICAASFRERVIHHAMVNVCGPLLERPLIHDTYACRKGRGQFKALERASIFARKSMFYLKMDVSKFFNSIDHEVLMRQLERLLKDQRLLDLFQKLLSSYSTAPAKGLPIGNLTSQYLANLYLSPFDHAIQEGRRGCPVDTAVGLPPDPESEVVAEPGVRLLDGSPGGLPANGYESHPLAKEGDRPPASPELVAGALSEPGCQGYVRYMDDMLVFGERDMLKALRGFANDFMRQELRLEIKGGGFINRCGLGIDFLGFRVFGDRLRLSRHANRRFVRKLERLDTLFASGAIDEQSYQARSTALFSFVQHGDTLAFRKKVLGKGQNRLEPADTGRQLEQRRAELSFGQPQQQQPVEPQQQQRVPAGFLPGSSTRFSHQSSLTRPLSSSRLCGTKTPAATSLVALAKSSCAAFLKIWLMQEVNFWQTIFARGFALDTGVF